MLSLPALVHNLSILETILVNSYYQIQDKKYDDYDRNVCAGRNENTEIVSVMIKYSQVIQHGEEIRLDYRHMKREAAVTTKIDKSEKKRCSNQKKFPQL